jgi:putative endopeptidase
MKTIQSYLPVFIFSLFLFSCTQKQEKTPSTTHDDFLWQWMDSTVKPGDDFFKFATGNWMKNNPIPASERRWGISNLVRNDIYQKLLKISEEAAADQNAKKGSNRQRIGDFWATGMDTASIEKLGIKPLEEKFAMINSIKSVDDLMRTIADFQIYAGSPLFGMYIGQDEMNSEKYLLHFYQGGIGLPNRDYYFNNDPRTKNIREEYKTHLSKMFMLLGDEKGTAEKNSRTVFKMETDLAKASKTLEELRDPYANYNKMPLSSMNKLAPSVKWNEVMEIMGIDADTVVVGQPDFLRQAEKSVHDYSIDDWKTYLRWNLVNNFASELNSDFDKQNFAFYGATMTGAKEQRPRWKRILDQEEIFLGDALGQLYVDAFVSPEMKKRYDKLVTSMMDTYRERIEKLDWMTDSTRQKALHKLSKVERKVCYPDKWRDYSSLNISRVSYINNVINCRRWQYQYYVDKLGKPVDRDEWEMTPQTYNAYYNPSNNEIVLPAAQFLIPGLEDSLADDAIIYGYAAASTIGHEITHGFDDEGRQFDEKGNLRNWWTAQDSVNFSQRAEKLAKQFSDYVVLDSLHVNGRASLGENIADLAGVVIGLEAFKKTEQYKKGEKIDGLTPLQRYFLGYTLGWLGHARDASLAMQVMTDVHAPNFLRVNGPFANVPEFYEAFGIKEGDKMWRPDSLRVKIW